MMKMQKWFQSTIFAVVLTYMIKLQLIQIAKLMFFAAPNEIENSFIELEGEYATIISKIKKCFTGFR